jgi:hypothetical protein
VYFANDAAPRLGRDFTPSRYGPYSERDRRLIDEIENTSQPALAKARKGNLVCKFDPTTPKTADQRPAVRAGAEKCSKSGLVEIQTKGARPGPRVRHK